MQLHHAKIFVICSAISYFTAYMNDRRNGTAQPNLGAKELKTFPIPIPPIEEQGRIVAKTEELMKQVERLVS